MIRAQSPGEKTVQFKGKMEKKVDFRLDQSLSALSSPALTYYCLKKEHIPSSSEGFAAHNVRKVLSGTSYAKDVDGYF